MNIEEIRKWSIDLMARSPAAYLTTVGPDGYPYTRAMLNLRNRKIYPNLAEVFSGHDEDFLIYFTTNTSSAKRDQILSNDKVSVYYCVPARYHGLMLMGNIEIVDDPAVKKMLWTPGWERYYPKGFDDPDHMVMRVFPRSARIWKGFKTEFPIGQ